MKLMPVYEDSTSNYLASNYFIENMTRKIDVTGSTVTN